MERKVSIVFDRKESGNMKIVVPDYEHSILNLMNSILKYYGAEYHYKPLSEAEEFLKGSYRHIVLMVMDGMGSSILEQHLEKDSFLRQHMRNRITSVFPPTTVAATTTFDSGIAPAEHNWLGWTLYFPEVGDNVAVFTNRKEDGTVASEEFVSRKYQSYEKVGDKIRKASPAKAYTVSPFGDYPIDTFDELLQGVRDLCSKEEQNYIYAYWPEPDHTMHECGCGSESAKAWVTLINRELEKLSEELKDTLIFVTADHGLLDTRNESLTEYPAIMECLERMPSIEPRSLACYVKEGMEEQFEAEFRKCFGEKFYLYTKEEVIKSRLFGPDVMHERFADTIGDYLAVGIDDVTIFNSSEEKDFFIGVHAGLSEDEMYVPLIVIDRK